MWIVAVDNVLKNDQGKQDNEGKTGRDVFRMMFFLSGGRGVNTGIIIDSIPGAGEVGTRGYNTRPNPET